MAANIPPDIRAILDQFYHKQLIERFGETSPTTDEEIAFIDELGASGVPTVPLPDGTEVTLPSAAAGFTAAPAGEFMPLPASEPGASGSRARTLAGIGLIVVAFVVLVLFVWNPFAGRGSAAQDGDEEPTMLSTLPPDIDKLISSGDTTAGGIVPRTLEIIPGDGISSTTFVVTLVEVKEADWPCPTAKFGGKPVACWVKGTVTNYLIGVPYGPEALALAEAIRANGGTLRLRLSSERVMNFKASVRDVERHETEVLAQKSFGVTIPLLRQPGSTRTLIVGTYDDSQDTGAIRATPAPAAIATQGPEAPPMTVANLGEIISLGMAEMTATGSAYVSDESRLDLEVHNLGNVPLVAGYGWQVWALRKDGEAVQAQADGNANIQPNGKATIAFTAQGKASAWRVVVGDQQVTVVLP